MLNLLLSHSFFYWQTYDCVCMFTVHVCIYKYILGILFCPLVVICALQNIQRNLKNMASLPSKQQNLKLCANSLNLVFFYLGSEPHRVLMWSINFSLCGRLKPESVSYRRPTVARSVYGCQMIWNSLFWESARVKTFHKSNQCIWANKSSNQA